MRMAFSRFSIAERRLLLQNQGFLKRTSSSSFFSSSSCSLGKSTKSSTTKRAEAAKKQKAAVVESYVKMYMLMNPGVFPKTKQVQNELGGSWSNLKDILKELKEKMTGDPRVFHEMASTKAEVKVEATSEAAVTSKVNDPETTIHPLDLHFHQNFVSSVKSHVTVDEASEAAAIHEVAKNEILVEDDDMGRELNSHLSSAVGHESDQKAACEQSPVMNEKMITNEEEASTASENGSNLSGSKSSDWKEPSQQLSFMNKQLISNEELTSESKNGPNLNDAKLSDQKASSMKLSFMIEKMVKDEEAPSVLLNDLDLTDAKSSDGRTLVDNGDTRSDMMVGQRPTVKKLASDGQMCTSLMDLFKVRYANAGADENNTINKKNTINNETLKGDMLSRSKVASANEFGKKEIIGLLDRVKELMNMSRPEDTFGEPNQHMVDLRNKNGIGPMLEHLKFQIPDEEQETLCEPGISDVINKPEQEETKAEPLDLVVKHASGSESKSAGHTIVCGGTAQNYNDEDPKKFSFEMFQSQVEREDGSGSDSDFEALDYPVESVRHIPPPINGLKPWTFLHTEKEKVQDRLVVKFLQKSASENDIAAAFEDCGPIANISIVQSGKENHFNYAFIHFKRAGGLRKAQTRTDIVIGGADVVVETCSPFWRNPVKMSTNPFGFPHVPMALLRRPSRTVMIKELSNDSFQRLRKILISFGRISGFAMGPSSSIVYVEFETEEAKEKALTVSSISISGRALSILRVDTPLTTVVRISDFGHVSDDEIHSICNSHGQVKRVVRRYSKTVDVHFLLTEWPNMVKILNSLNGVVVNKNRWKAQPATVIPAEILQTLWRKPDGWQYVLSFLRKLCQKIERDSTNTSKLTDLVTEFYGEKA